MFISPGLIMKSLETTGPFQKIVGQLQVSMREGLPTGAVDWKKVEKRWTPLLRMAEMIAKIEDKATRTKRNVSWEEKAAKDLGVDLDRKRNDSDDDDDGVDARDKKQLDQLKQQLSSMLR